MRRKCKPLKSMAARRLFDYRHQSCPNAPLAMRFRNEQFIEDKGADFGKEIERHKRDLLVAPQGQKLLDAFPFGLAEAQCASAGLRYRSGERASLNINVTALSAMISSAAKFLISVATSMRTHSRSSGVAKRMSSAGSMAVSMRYRCDASNRFQDTSGSRST